MHQRHLRGKKEVPPKRRRVDYAYRRSHLLPEEFVQHATEPGYHRFPIANMLHLLRIDSDACCLLLGKTISKRMRTINKLLIGIFVGAILVNLLAAMWEFTHPGFFEDNSWKFLVFKTVFYITFFLCPYAAISELFPRKFAWYMFALFALISVIIALFNCYEKLKASLTLAYVNVVDATRPMLSRVTTDDQVLPTTDAAAMSCIAAAAEDQQNLGSSPNLPCLSATDPAASQELANLNGFTIIPFPTSAQN